MCDGETVDPLTNARLTHRRGNVSQRRSARERQRDDVRLVVVAG